MLAIALQRIARGESHAANRFETPAMSRCLKAGGSRAISRSHLVERRKTGVASGRVVRTATTRPPDLSHGRGSVKGPHARYSPIVTDSVVRSTQRPRLRTLTAVGSHCYRTRGREATGSARGEDFCRVHMRVEHSICLWCNRTVTAGRGAQRVSELAVWNSLRGSMPSGVS